ncbi:saccharopine dehydrogenase family protein [Rhodobaculum claviforme]|uniref:Saccharopine dehydrogenase n=1 Tax=Rhodobaculum claviforme TaxID=1549854 RepID=A0A934TLH9_9RHOB|nr:saccharopine dehydrogenase family protein [Rhodobaculum claviforme]MBK5927759.1 saccharopine dehydrogenase [Rhodobaculum claviforme]
MTTIHWCGTGLSTVPGLRHLIAEGAHPVVVWNRTVAKAAEAVGDLTGDLRAFDAEALGAVLAPGDVVVSMLPADHHVDLARRAIAAGAHFVSSSYIAPPMAALDGAARDAGVAVVGEVGLDPGIDHLMAHDLVEGYRASGLHTPDTVLSFTSYCGGVPKHPNPFRYKFSWSPLGVLKALRSPSRSLKEFEVLDVARPWDAISTFDAPLPTPETFEVYPNRDSLPFMAQYRFDPAWKVRDFVRGTLRLGGWSDAWAPVFAEVETLEGPAGDARLAEMAEGFWREHAYGDGELDRVVLFVTLRAERDGAPVWHQTWAMDAWGDSRGSAMARLVSHPVALAVEGAASGRLSPGVQAAPHDPALIAAWMAEVGRQAQYLERIDHL